ncbi:MAG: 2OG-Fe(II) oxygenase [Rhodospirillales bacterium]|nr:2OG-Fe(II) oxygenase [Alphaproteobacteria bacterium]MBL6947671.1 2OG-Fe(II) oxygenase [Rhodospirillales bacterium]
MAQQNAQHARPLGAGDRIPNFIRKDHLGKIFEFYTSISGGSMVFVILDRNGEGTESLLRLLDEKRTGFEAQNAHPYAFLNTTRDVQRALGLDLDLQFPLFSDDGSQLTDWFLESAGVRAPAVFVLDANQRLVSFMGGAEGDATALVDFALAEVTKLAPKGEPQIFTSAAPVLLIPNVFNPEYCQRLINLWETGDQEEGMVSDGDGENQGRKIDPGSKRRKDHTIRDMDLMAEIKSVLAPRLGPEAQKVHYYGSWMFEAFRIGCYDWTDAGFFKAHRDNFNENLQHRRYAVSINLNAEDYEGGDLRFPEYGHDLYRPPTGGAAVFSCSLLHEVLPVTKGRRFVFLTFLSDPQP